MNKNNNKETEQCDIPSVIGSVYSTETRKCGSCKHFKLDFNANVMGICKKKLMTVTSTMLVTFKNDDGTCFEEHFL